MSPSLGSIDIVYQPVTQEANADVCLGASIAAQKYGPPLVGIAETISAMPKPTNIAASLVRRSSSFSSVRD